jgi:hypothetical protein
MSVAVDRCETCGGLVDLEDLFCANCGREVPDHDDARKGTLALGARGFGCKNCGASMAYDAGSQALKCPFCGSASLEEDGIKGVLAPELILPFVIDQAGAEGSLRGWLGSSFWHPNDLNAAAVLTDLKAIYVPYWIFHAHVQTHWTADTVRTPPGAMAPWFPVSGYGEHDYQDLWVPASEGISAKELDAVGPYDASVGVAPESVDLGGVTVEQFSVSRRYARPLAQERVEDMERGGIAAELGGPGRNIKVSTIMIDATSRAAMAPVYVMAYRYRDRLFRFVLNGQTGKFTGRAPISATKVIGVVLGTIAVAALIVGGLILILR